MAELDAVRALSGAARANICLADLRIVTKYLI
jgi:hypothetical protein